MCLLPTKLCVCYFESLQAALLEAAYKNIVVTLLIKSTSDVLLDRTANSVSYGAFFFAGTFVVQVANLWKRNASVTRVSKHFRQNTSQTD